MKEPVPDESSIRKRLERGLNVADAVYRSVYWWVLVEYRNLFDLIFKYRKFSAAVAALSAYFIIFTVVPKAIQLLVPVTIQSYTNVMVSSMLSFVLAYLLWHRLNETTSTTLRLIPQHSALRHMPKRPDAAPAESDSRHIIYEPEPKRWWFFIEVALSISIVLLPYWFGIRWIVQYAAANNGFMTGFYALQMAVYTVILYFILNEVYVRMSPSKTEACPELYGCIQFGTIKLIKKTREGESSDIIVKIAPGTYISEDHHVEAELFAAGLTVDGDKKQKRTIDSKSLLKVTTFRGVSPNGTRCWYLDNSLSNRCDKFICLLNNYVNSDTNMRIYEILPIAHDWGYIGDNEISDCIFIGEKSGRLKLYPSIKLYPSKIIPESTNGMPKELRSNRRAVFGHFGSMSPLGYRVASEALRTISLGITPAGVEYAESMEYGRLTYLWNCACPTAGKQTINIILRAWDKSGVMHEKRIRHELQVAGLVSRSWPPLLTSLFGAINILAVLHTIGVF
jgi:hypothetical protein